MNARNIFLDKDIFDMPEKEASEILESIAYQLHYDNENDSTLNKLVLMVMFGNEDIDAIVVCDEQFFNYPLDKKINVIKHLCFERVKKAYKDNSSK